MELRTQNSVYKLDLVSRTVTGGIFNEAKAYDSVHFLLGAPAVFFMLNGDIVTTSTVQNINVGNIA